MDEKLTPAQKREKFAFDYARHADCRWAAEVAGLDVKACEKHLMNVDSLLSKAVDRAFMVRNVYGRYAHDETVKAELLRLGMTAEREETRLSALKALVGHGQEKYALIGLHEYWTTQVNTKDGGQDA